MCQPLHPRPASEDKYTPKPEAKKAMQVHNNGLDPCFEDFKLGISSIKFNDAISKVGPPPNVIRGGKHQPMCATYHLRGVKPAIFKLSSPQVFMILCSLVKMAGTPPPLAFLNKDGLATSNPFGNDPTPGL